jgi:hypothetical protein
MSEQGALPPATDREAGNSGGFEVKVDWLQFSVMGKSADDVEADMVGFLPNGFVEVEAGFAGYEFQRVSGPVRLLYSKRRPEVHVIFTGEGCDMLGGQEMQRLISYVRENGHPSRVDLAGDDFNRVVSPADVRDAYKAGEVVSHAERWRFMENDKGGTTFYLGSPSSRQQLRVYDKEVESAGVTASTRWELQARDDAAETLVMQLASEPWGDVFAGRLVQFVDFRDRGADGTVTRCPRVPWFETLVGQAKKALAYLPKPPRTVGEVEEWFRKYCAPMAAVLLKVGGGDWLVDMMEDGRQRWRGRHRVLVAAA